MNKKKNRISAVLFVLLTAVVVIVGLVVVRTRRQGDLQKSGGFATSETASQTGPLGSFAEWTAPIEYDGSTMAEYPASADDLVEPQSPETAAKATTAGQAPSAGQTTAAGQTTTAGQATAAGQATTAGQASAPSQTASGSTLHTYGQGAEYAYAYAGYTPKQANMNIAEWSLLLVNRNYILPQDYAPDLAEAVRGSGVQMDARVAPYYQKMYDAAQQDGITLTPLSGHRRISRQKTNFENKIQLYVNQGYDRAEATRMAAKIILPPGTSEHNAGLAMDIISLDVDFEETRAFAWLQEHAQDYGFILRYPKNKESVTEITYEPWHWRYVGVSHAKAIKQSGQCLEEYLGVTR